MGGRCSKTWSELTRQRLLLAIGALALCASTVSGQHRISLPGHNTPVADLAFAPDEVLLASTSGRVQFYDLLSRRERRPFALKGTIHAIAFAPNGQHLAVTTGKSLQLWDIPSRSLCAELQ